MKPLLKHCGQFWATLYKRDIDTLERVHQTVTTKMKGLEPSSDKSPVCPSKTSSHPPSPLFQAVRIPGIGTFAVVRKRVALSEQDLVIVERPVFRPEKAVVQDHELRYGCKDFPGHQDFEQLPYAEIASENAVSEGTVQLYMERTTHLFHACVENGQNVAIIWRDVGMLIVQGKDMKMRFYLHFLERLNGTGKMLQALLEMPEMRDSVISRHDTAASQTSSGRVIVLPWYQLETVPKMPALIDLKGCVKGKGDGLWCEPAPAANLCARDQCRNPRAGFP
ncbi:coiled-coil domain-containing protein 81-like [Patagioenas fasciata]|uniref:coiled-coil domain-containing protein 81-like n=2 Tax=Patagioenas fasciata TaxID=372321 RepID=UPI003A99D017